jgi:hypothetical protein
VEIATEPTPLAMHFPVLCGMLREMAAAAKRPDVFAWESRGILSWRAVVCVLFDSSAYQGENEWHGAW